MQQQDGEQIKAFAARVKGTAKNCHLTIKCIKEECDPEVPYLEETTYHVVMAGIHNQVLCEKIKAQAMRGTVKDLTSLINYVSPEESSKAKLSVHEEPQISVVLKKSDYARNKSAKYICCGATKHGEKNKNRKEL